MEETSLESLFRQPLRLIEDIKFATEEVGFNHQECQKLCTHVDTLSTRLRTAVHMVRQHNPRFCEGPTRRILDATSHTLETCCFLIRKCRKGGFLKRLVTITTATEFGGANSSVEDAIANVNWLLNSVSDEEIGNVIGMPPIANSVPNLAVIWSLLSKLQGGTQELREAAVIDLVLMASASEQNSQFIIEEGGVPLLLKALQDSTLQGKVMAATALRNLAVSRERVRKMVDQGVIPACVRVLEHGAVQVQAKVVWALAEMVLKDQEIQIELGNAHAIMPLVALMLETIDEDYRSSKARSAKVLVSENLHPVKEATGSEGVGSSGAVRDATERTCDIGERLDHNLTHSDSSQTLYDTSGFAASTSRAKVKSDELKADLQVQVTRALWLLAASNVNSSRKIAETRAMLGLTKLIELAHGEVQRNAVMAIMELAAVAEQNADFRKFAFKLTSPAAKATVNQLHRIIIDDLVDPNLQVCCIRAVGCLARAFSAKDNKLIKALVLKLSNPDREYRSVAIEAIIALLKFIDKENFLWQEHSLAILEVQGLPFLVQLVALDVDKTVQFPAIHLLSQLALHVGRTRGEAFQEAAALSVMKSVASSASTMRGYGQFSPEEDLFQAIYHLEFCQAGNVGQQSSHE